MSECPVFEQFLADVQPDAEIVERLRVGLRDALVDVAVAENLVADAVNVPLKDAGTFGTEFGK